MKRLMTLVSVLAVFVAFPGMATAAPPERESFEGDTADAIWEEEGEDTYAFTLVALRTGIVTSEGEKSDESSVEVFRFEFDEAGFRQFFGETELDPSQFELDAAGGAFSASVQTTLDVFGEECSATTATCETFGPITITVNVVWGETTGRIYPATLARSRLSPFGFNAGVERQLARYTTATGSVSGPMSLTLGDTNDATISRLVDATWVRVTAL